MDRSRPTTPKVLCCVIHSQSAMLCNSSPIQDQPLQLGTNSPRNSGFHALACIVAFIYLNSFVVFPRRTYQLSRQYKRIDVQAYRQTYRQRNRHRPTNSAVMPMCRQTCYPTIYRQTDGHNTHKNKQTKQKQTNKPNKNRQTNRETDNRRVRTEGR